ncbi:prepilin-type N-terminal cleavage/methylation domain-containing protein [Robertmurraya sp. GLU-23]
MVNNQKGVTLIELLIVILIMVSVSGLVFALFSYGIKMESAVSKENELQREARFIMETISNAVRDGEDVRSKISFSNNELKLESNLLSNNVKQFDFMPDVENASQFKVTLVLEKDKQEYKISTKVTSNGEERVRY